MNTKAIRRFVIYFSVIYGVALLISPVCDKFYSEFFQHTGGRVVSFLIPKGIVGLMAVKDAKQTKFSTNIRIANKKEYLDAMQNRRPYRSMNSSVSAYYSGYLPIMLTLALLLAIPGMARKQKALALLGGLIAIQLFIFLKLYIQVLYEFDRNDWMQVVKFSQPGREALDNLYLLFVMSMSLNFIVPVVIFVAAVLLFRNELIPSVWPKSAA